MSHSKASTSQENHGLDFAGNFSGDSVLVTGGLTLEDEILLRRVDGSAPLMMLMVGESCVTVLNIQFSVVTYSNMSEQVSTGKANEAAVAGYVETSLQQGP